MAEARLVNAEVVRDDGTDGGTSGSTVQGHTDDTKQEQQNITDVQQHLGEREDRTQNQSSAPDGTLGRGIPCPYIGYGRSQRRDLLMRQQSIPGEQTPRKPQPSDSLPVVGRPLKNESVNVAERGNEGAYRMSSNAYRPLYKYGAELYPESTRGSGYRAQSQNARLKLYPEFMPGTSTGVHVTQSFTPNQNPLLKSGDTAKRQEEGEMEKAILVSSTVVVRGFEDISQDTLEMYFESKKRTGGGEIERFALIDEGEATIVFKEPEVADRVLAREEPFVLEGKTLTVGRPPKVDPSTIVVQNIAPNVSKDALELFFESSKRSGGSDVKNIEYDPGSGTATVTFEDEEVAQRVLARAAEKPLIHEDSELHISPQTLAAPEPEDPRVVVVEGVGASTTEDVLVMFLENRKRSGGGEVEHIEYDRESGMAKVTFEEEEDALHVLEKETLQLEGSTLKICRPEKISVPKPTTKGKMTKAQRPKSLTRQHEETFHTLMVTGVKTTREKELKKFLENQRESGGGVIQDLETYPERNLAVVRFKNSGDAQNVMQRGVLTLRGLTLRVSPVDTSVRDSRRFTGPLAIAVTNIKPNTKPEHVKLFFKNRRQSGGGELAKFYWNAETGKAVITFNNAETVRNVCDKHSADGFVVNNCELDVTMLTQTLLPRLITGPKEPQKAIIVEAPTVTPEELEDYLLSIDSVTLEVAKILYSFTNKTILLEFKDEIDFGELGLLFATRPLKEHMMTLQRVGLPTKIQVHDFEPSEVSEQLLELYFQDTSDGGDVTMETFNKEQKYAILECCEPTVVSSIIQKKHKVGGKKIVVSSYYEDFGVLPPHYDASRPWNYMPDPYLHPLNTDEHTAAHIHEFLDQMTTVRDLWGDIGQNDKLFTIDWEKSSPRGLMLGCHSEYEPDQHTRAWEDICQEKIGTLLSDISSIQIATLAKLFNAVRDEAKRLNEKNEVVLEIDEKQAVIVITGWEPDVKPIQHSLEKLNSKLQEDLERAQKSVTETMTFSQIHVTLIQATKYHEQIQAKYPGLSVEFPKSGRMILRGLPQEVKDAKVLLYENIMMHAVSECLPLGPDVCALFCKKEVHKSAYKEFKKDNIVAVLEGTPTHVELHALTKGELKRARTHCEKLVVAQIMNLAPENLPILQLEVWEKLQASLLAKYSDVLSMEVDQSDPKIKITCLTEIYNEVSEGIKNCLEEHSVYEEFVDLVPGCVKLLQKYRKPDINKLVKQLKSCCVSCEVIKTEARTGYKIKGTKYGLPKVVEAINEMVSHIKEHYHKVSQPGMPHYFRSPRGREFLETLELKYPVSCEIVDPAELLTGKPLSETRTKDGMQEFYDVQLLGGQRLKVLKGDITKLKVGAIVNAANSELDHSGGLALAIVKAGGDTIQGECKSHVRHNGRVLPGRVFLGRKTGRLHCDYVIHAVGPVYQVYGNNHNKANELYEAAFSSLSVASEENVCSIALPALSTGIYHYPLKEATRIICEAAIDFLTQNDSSVKEVCLIDVLPNTVTAFRQSLIEVLGEKKIQTKSFQSPQQRSFPSGGAHGARTSVKAHAARPSTSWQGGPSTVTLRLSNGVTVQIKTSNIVKEQVDVIVNTCNQQLDLSQGAIASSILSAAGKTIQSECRSNAPQGVNMGGIVRTSAGKLAGVQAIYHGACQEWDGSAGQSTKVLKQFISSCLDGADQDGYTSIAFPAIGTGNLRIPANLACQYMVEEFMSFSKKHPSTSLRDIRVVLYEKDTQTVKAFMDYASALSGAPPVAPKSKRVMKSMSAFKSASGDSYRDFVRQDDQNLLVKVGSIDVLVNEGDITKETTEAIVNSTNAVLDFSQGAVAAAILKKGGNSILMECQKILASNGRIVENALTNAGNLNCSKIVHMDANTTDWNKAIRSTLQFADQNKLKSLAFPAIGTGSLGLSPATMAHIMLQAIAQFATGDSPQFLDTIHITIFDSKVFKDFQKEVGHVMKGERPGILDSFKGLFKSMAQAFRPGRKTEHGTAGQESSKYMYEPNRAQQFPSGVPGPKVPASRESIVIHIYAQAQDTIDTVVTRLQKACNDETSTENLDGEEEREIIKKLTSEQLVEICSLEHQYMVHIEVDKGVRLQRICLSGATKDVAACATKIRSMLQAVKKEEETAQQAEHINNLVQWEYQSQGSYSTYSKDINLRIETAFGKKEPAVDWEEENGDKFVVDFNKMMETKLGRSGQSVPVRRNLPSSDGAIALPKQWASMNKKDPFLLVQLNPADTEYQAVNNAFSATYRSNRIVQIQRVQNPKLYQQYHVTKNHMRNSNPKHHSIEHTLYHGTDDSVLNDINTGGFNRSYCGKNATAYGNGVYFAVQARYSASNTYSRPNQNNQKHMYQCKVLTGEYTRGAGAMVAPPARNQQEKYDSVVDNVNQPSMFVIFHDTQAYPEYLITFM